MNYNVDATEYYERGTPDTNSFSNANFAAMVERPIKQLIARYGLSGKSILSLGSGAAFEEFWMLQAGAKLTLNDLDAANGTIKPYLESLPEGQLVYYLEDAAETIKVVQPHDVLYVSSFHPDEIRRERIMAKHGIWPKGESPYMPLLLDALTCVKPGGLAIFQHYRGGVDPSVNSDYISLLRETFAVHDISLIDVYAYRQGPTKMLIVGCRGAVPELGPEISEFHGRYPYAWIRRDIVKLWDFRSGLTPLNYPGLVERVRRKIVNKVRRAFL